MKRAWFRSDLIGQLAGCGRVHGIPVEQLQLNVYAVIDERIYGILQLRGARVHAALLFNPVPTSAVRAVLVLTNADPLETCVEHPCPPPAVPGQIWSAWKIRVNAETILNLRGTLGRNVIGKRFSRVLRSQRARSRNANRKKNHETVPAAAFQGDSLHCLIRGALKRAEGSDGRLSREAIAHHRDCLPDPKSWLHARVPRRNKAQFGNSLDNALPNVAVGAVSSPIPRLAQTVVSHSTREKHQAMTGQFPVHSEMRQPRQRTAEGRSGPAPSPHIAAHMLEISASQAERLQLLHRT